MTALARDPVVVKLAKDLGLEFRGDCLAHIRTFALTEVTRLTDGFPVPDLDSLRRILANRLRLGIEFVRSDADITRIARDHSSFDPSLPRRLQSEFTKLGTEGIVLQRQDDDPLGIRYLAVIDARGERGVRAYFTAWHEVAHLLTYPPQLSLPGFRRTPRDEERKDPLESVVDHVAGLLAFHEPLYRPVLERAIEEHGALSFGAIDAARAEATPEASLFAAAIGSIRYAGTPAALVRVGLGLKKAQAREIRSGQGSFSFAPQSAPALRALDVIHNEPGQASDLRIRRNMRIPEDSVLHAAFDSPADGDFAADEDQSWWETSDAGSLPELEIRVEATRRGGYVYGLITVRD